MKEGILICVVIFLREFEKICIGEKILIFLFIFYIKIKMMVGFSMLRLWSVMYELIFKFKVGYGYVCCSFLKSN